MKDGFAFADKIGEKYKVVYENPYDAFQNRNNNKELCLVENNKVVFILPTNSISLKWAIACAEHVLYIFENKYPKDQRPRNAIRAAKEYIKTPTKENENLASAASNEAYNAALTASVNIDYDAYYAAQAVYYAGYIAANKASSANLASYCAVHAKANSAEAVEIKWQRKTLDKIVTNAIYGDVFINILAGRKKNLRSRPRPKDIERLPRELLLFIYNYL